MDTSSLLWNAIWRSTVFGILIHLSITVIVGFPFGLIGLIFGIPLSLGVAIPSAIANGLLLAVVTSLFFSPLTNPELYHFIMIFIAALVGCLLGGCIMSILVSSNDMMLGSNAANLAKYFQ
ncbi:MAG: hypothetical protein HC903_24620 [Methylacidiphilales bacterium]|nr:hypothetical protein [Candidatus Methylacidiphilales bacterium]